MNEQPKCLTPEQIKRFLDNARTPTEEAIAANAHLQNCARCQQALRNGVQRTTEQLLHRLAPQDELVYSGDKTVCLEEDLILRYVQGETDSCENEIVDLHLADCEFCQADVTALQILRREMEAEPRLGFADWLLSHWQPVWKRLVAAPARPLLVLSTGAVAAGCVLYAALVLPLQKQLREKSEQNRTLLAQSDSRLQTRNQMLERTQTELESLRKQQQQTPLRDVVRLPIQEAGEPLLSDKQGRIGRIQWFPPILGKSLTNPQLAFAAGQKNLQTVVPEPIQTMGVDNKRETRVEPISPVAGIVETQTPTLSWKPLAGASRYQIERRILAKNEDMKLIDVSKSTAWTVDPPLARDMVYQWQIVAFNDKNEKIAHSNPLLFKVLDAQTAQYLMEFAGSPLTRCTLYLNAGMPDEAEKELQSYLRGNSVSPAVQLLQRNIQALKQKAQAFKQQILRPR